MYDMINNFKYYWLIPVILSISVLLLWIVIPVFGASMQLMMYNITYPDHWNVYQNNPMSAMMYTEVFELPNFFIEIPPMDCKEDYNYTLTDEHKITYTYVKCDEILDLEITGIFFKEKFEEELPQLLQLVNSASHR